MTSKYKTVAYLINKGYECIEYSDGSKHWFLNGEFHREDGPAIEYPGGSKSWCLNGEFHREDGPAIEYSNGTKIWCLNGKYHKEDGPAVEDSNGDKEWYLNDKEITLETKSKNSKVKKLQDLMKIQEVLEA